jgi:hypothetical protein
MQHVTKGTLKSARFSVLLLIGLALAACKGAEEPAETTTNDSPLLSLNDSPVAKDDAFTVDQGSTSNFDLAANDSDAEDGLDLGSIAIDATPVNGEVTVNNDGTVDYTHDGSAVTADEFSYTIKDHSGAVSNTADVTITVRPASPVAVKAGVYNSTVVEGAGALEFIVSLAVPGADTVSIDYETADATALAGTDYVAASGTLQFAPGEVRKPVSVAVLSNGADPTGTSRNMKLLLSNAQNAVLTVDNATGTIIDRDAMSTDAAFDHNWSAVGVFTNAATCGADCHKADATQLIMTFDGKDVSPGAQWKHSVMANSFNDPYWQAAVQDEVESFPALAGFIEDTCTKCHAPMGHTNAHQSNAGLDFYRFDNARSEDHAREGVSCTLCHQMQESDADSGEYVISDTASIIYGPYDAPLATRMRRDTGYTPAYGDHMEKSRFCSSCHTLYTPAIDPDTGMPSGPNTGLPSATKGFLEQGPYLEWENSIYATGAAPTHCQDCHMPVPSETYQTPISTLPSSSPNRTPYGQHTLVGGNAHLLKILRDYRSELGIAGSTSINGFNDQIALTQNFLAGAATVSVSTTATTDSQLNFDIEVTNLAGHKLPSSYPSRRTWLHVTVMDNAGKVVFESGRPDARGYISTDEARLKADCMSIDKLEGFDSSLCYEPHRDVITDPSQVAIYETVLGDVKGNITHTLLYGAQYLKDNRIPPIGFENSNAMEVQTLPSGVDGDSDFNCVGGSEGCGADTVHYQVDVTGETGPFSVEARLLYQATQPAFVDGMHTDGDRVNRFKVMYDAVPPSVEVLATATGP